MNSGLASEVEVDEAIRALVIPARKIEMMAPSVPPHASDNVSLFLASLFFFLSFAFASLFSVLSLYTTWPIC